MANMLLAPPARVLRSLTDRLFSGVAVGGIVLFVIGVSGGAWWTLQRIDTAVRESVRRTLVTVLATAREASRHWATRQQALAASMASADGLARAVEHLAVARAKDAFTYRRPNRSLSAARALRSGRTG